MEQSKTKGWTTNTKPVSDSGHTQVTVIRYKDYKAQVTGDGKWGDVQKQGWNKQ